MHATAILALSLLLLSFDRWGFQVPSLSLDGVEGAFSKMLRLVDSRWSERTSFLIFLLVPSFLFWSFEHFLHTQKIWWLAFLLSIGLLLLLWQRPDDPRREIPSSVGLWLDAIHLRFFFFPVCLMTMGSWLAIALSLYTAIQPRHAFREASALALSQQIDRILRQTCMIFWALAFGLATHRRSCRSFRLQEYAPLLLQHPDETLRAIIRDRLGLMPQTPMNPPVLWEVLRYTWRALLILACLGTLFELSALL